ncbi:phosphotyrosine protein phosphatase I superfamily [Chaetomium tenue]|uniref:Phosphotyrosine protein phosphatase I superfamily n=1 Tax=Chaetomium tenue TaxID=1854479 RepID=A0ACB7PL68_9PEZI|nr:phosphotyrosine protein phosphatase I superfamily [Chaetomium globosum]
MSDQLSVLFVCLGNICRSTMAEGVFQSLARKEPYSELVGKIDSCGTGAYHVGDGPDERTMETLEDHGITDYVHCARKVDASDFDKFDYIFAMDRGNLADLERIQRRKPSSKAKLMLFGEYSGTGKTEIISDPYYGAIQPRTMPLNGLSPTATWVAQDRQAAGISARELARQGFIPALT